MSVHKFTFRKFLRFKNLLTSGTFNDLLKTFEFECVEIRRLEAQVAVIGLKNGSMQGSLEATALKLTGLKMRRHHTHTVHTVNISS